MASNGTAPDSGVVDDEGGVERGEGGVVDPGDGSAPVTPDASPPPRGDDAGPPLPPPDAAPPPLEGGDRYTWLKQAMVGTWEGTRTTPWVAPATVRVHFDASGIYTAHCLSGGGSNCVAFYYGTDEDLPNKRYALYDLHADLTGVARIEIAFSATEVQEGTLDSVNADPDALALSFDFWATWGAGRSGPVHFDLHRVGP